MKRKIREVLVIDGYNIINAWDELAETAETSLENAREKLNFMIAEYASYKDIHSYIIYDAYRVKTVLPREEKNRNITVIFTKENQTADSFIERFIHDFEDKRNTIIRVATDDMAEQNLILGKGASRMSARELHLEVKDSQKKIREKISRRHVSKNTLDTILNQEIIDKLEDMRRGK